MAIALEGGGVRHAKGANNGGAFPVRNSPVLGALTFAPRRGCGQRHCSLARRCGPHGRGRGDLSGTSERVAFALLAFWLAWCGMSGLYGRLALCGLDLTRESVSTAILVLPCTCVALPESSWVVKTGVL